MGRRGSVVSINVITLIDTTEQDNVCYKVRRCKPANMLTSTSAYILMGKGVKDTSS